LDRSENKEEIITIEVDEGKAEFAKKLQKHARFAEEFRQRALKATDPNQKAFFALVASTEHYHAESLHYHQWSIDTLIDMGKDMLEVSSKIMQLEKDVQKLQGKTDVEIAELNKGMETIREKALKLMQRISKQLTEKTKQETEDKEKQKKQDSERLDWILRGGH